MVAADAETQSVNLVTSQNIFRLELTPDTYYDPEPPETIGLFNSEEEAKEALAIFIMDKWARQGGVDIAPWGTGSFNEDTLSEEWGEKAVLFARTHSAEKIISTYFDPRANLDIWGDRGWSLRNGYYSYRISIETQYQFRGKLINWERPISRF